MAATLTGGKVLAITCTAFGIIIAVNGVMAWKAVSTFPGLEVRNSYVASQVFDTERAAQAALGWAVETGYADGRLTLTIRDAEGLPAPVAALSATVGRTTHAREDVTPAFTAAAGRFEAALDLAPGLWLIHLRAEAADGTAFRQRLDFLVRG